MTLVDSIGIRRLGRVAYLPTLEAKRSLTSPRKESSSDEFWLLDRERTALMHYDDQGRFDHGETVEGIEASPIVLAADTAWDAGEPFTQWWDRHPQYHGPVRASA